MAQKPFLSKIYCFCLQVLASFICPVGVNISAESNIDNIPLTVSDEDITNVLPSLPEILMNSCLIPTLASYLRNDSGTLLAVVIVVMVMMMVVVMMVVMVVNVMMVVMVMVVVVMVVIVVMVIAVLSFLVSVVSLVFVLVFVSVVVLVLIEGSHILMVGNSARYIFI